MLCEIDAGGKVVGVMFVFNCRKTFRKNFIHFRKMFSFAFFF